MFEPRFHAVIYTWHFQPHINPVWTSYKVATKTFHVIQGPLNTFRLVACFLHEISTGLYFMTFAAGLFEQNWAKKQIWLFTIFLVVVWGKDSVMKGTVKLFILFKGVNKLLQSLALLWVFSREGHHFEPYRYFSTPYAWRNEEQERKKIRKKKESIIQ